LAAIIIEKADAESKPTRDTICSELLIKLIDACEEYDMSGVDAAMDEIEKCEYETDKELSAWLREKVDLINFSDIIDRFGEKTIEGGLDE
jgi:hypothetical protein